MDAVRHANVYPTCRLDKSNRAVYEPEDVWAKRAALVKPDTRTTVSNSKARVMFKQKVMAISTTGVTKADMENIDLVKEVRCVKSIGRSASVGCSRPAFEGCAEQGVERTIHPCTPLLLMYDAIGSLSAVAQITHARASSSAVKSHELCTRHQTAKFRILAKSVERHSKCFRTCTTDVVV